MKSRGSLLGEGDADFNLQYAENMHYWETIT